MEQVSYPWQAKHQDHRGPNVDYSEIHKLKDGPPYDNIRVTNHGIEAIRTQSEKFKAVDSLRIAPESGSYSTASYGKLTPCEKNVGNVYGREYTRESSWNGNEEDVNTEAEEFIQMEHQKLKLRRWMPTNSFNY